ncbi:hypothetical protein WN982_23295 [Paraburkholderia sp. IMGN_8]|uniref:hypothetical protein n=1 Tax=Paraburkholderia sp. IMGN_8 TaxID=3136564 RepID=UPI003100FC35
MGQNENERLQESAAADNGIEDNLYNYASTGQVSDYLESTQLNKFGTKGGTGFAAEDANALNEKLRGVTVNQVGTDNAKNGADRVADGIHVQTKYFDFAAKTVNDAFDKATGAYRYPYAPIKRVFGKLLPRRRSPAGSRCARLCTVRRAGWGCIASRFFCRGLAGHVTGGQYDEAYKGPVRLAPSSAPVGILKVDDRNEPRAPVDYSLSSRRGFPWLGQHGGLQNLVELRLTQ